MAFGTGGLLTREPDVAASRREKGSGAFALPLRAGGLLGAAALFGASLTPSLYPRWWLVQATLSGVALAVGYGVGTAAGALARRVVRLGPPAGVRQAAYRGAGLLAIGLVVAALVWNHRWQVDVRALMGLEPHVAYYPFALTPVALVTAYLGVLLGRGVRAAHRAYVRLLGRVVPGRWRLPARFVITLIVLYLVVDGLLLGQAGPVLHAALVASDARLDADVTQPETTHRAGSAGSLIPWTTLSAPGRAWVSQGPTVGELAAFSGSAATTPIRVYAGLGSAPTDHERARLAVAELERTGAFEREVLVVVTPTGSGSINPYAIDALEYLYGGDTAAVAMQYGYLPSWVTMAGNQERAKQGATALFGAVTERLQQLPVGSRPKLLVYAESLGSFGSEANFADLADVRARTDGVLWVGPTRGNRLWRQLTADRDAGSPLWRPVYRAGTAVRFGSDGGSLLQPGSDWPFPRVAYLQHATDPITWHAPRILIERPQWLESPRGPDLSDAMRYLPVITAWQLSVDMALAETAPVGHGHMYGPEQAEAWALIAPPAGWSQADTRRLVAALTER